jgi:acetyl-CoA synthetase
VISATERYRAARDSLLSLRGRYDSAVEAFSFPALDGPFNWAHDWFDVVAEGRAQTALVIVDEDGSRTSLTFDEVRQRSNRVAAFLRSQGIGRGDPVLLMLGNQVELWDCMLAVMKIGAVLLPTTTALGPADLADRVERARVAAVICNPVDTPKFADIAGDYVRLATSGVEDWRDLHDAAGHSCESLPHPGTDASDALLLYFTSGTTSRPKLVEHNQVSYPVGHLSTMYWLGVQPGDIHQNVSSPGWAKHAWSCFFAPWAAEATIFIYNYGKFDPAAVIGQLEAEQVTTFCAPPTVWRMMITADLGRRPSALREAVSAGEPLNPEVITQIQDRWGVAVRDGYGQTETTALVGNPPGLSLRPGSMGRMLPGVPVALVDPLTKQPVTGPGEGEVCLDLAARPVNLMVGYVDDPERHADAMADGYYHTGDVASVDEDGYITYVGRTDDIFKASDYKISPFELESALIEHPAVAEAAVVPAPDAIRLAVPKAYVALVPGFDPTAETARHILEFARRRLPSFQRIRRVEFCDLPKTVSGKIRRVELRQREEQLGRDGLQSGWSDTDFPDITSSSPERPAPD